MGILDGGVARLFSTAFGGMYLDGKAHVGTQQPIYDGVRIIGYTDTGDVDIKVQTDKTSDALKTKERYIVGDVMLIILSITPSGDQAGEIHVSLTTDSQVTDGYGDKYRLLDVEQDAARSHWLCHGRAV